jgi:predicted alpha/beta hydrolase
VQRKTLRIVSSDGASAALELFLPDDAPRAAVFWLPALGVGIAPNGAFATALAQAGVAVAVLEWRGLGSSDRRASHACDWGYREILDLDIPAALSAARAAVPGVAWWLGGHSLGGQFALIEASRRPAEYSGALLIGSGHPYWRSFGGMRGPALLGLLMTIPAITAARGHFPGRRLRFAGREASRLMRDWACTARRGDYRVAPFEDALDTALRGYTGPVLGLRFADDGLAPAPALARLRQLTPDARWSTDLLSAADFAHRRADHFGWLKQPDAVVKRVLQWLDSASLGSGERSPTD